jgi:multicomponent Na+:H+ antiporter subunit D
MNLLSADLFSTHLPVLLIVIPLMAAPLCVMARHALIAWVIALFANLSIVLMAVIVWLNVYDSQPLHYALGGWVAPTGIEYYIDTLNASLLVVITLISLFALIYSYTSIQKEIAKPRHYLFYTGWLLCLTGLLGIVITGDAFNVFVFLEISSLSMYMLIALGSERKQALMAAFRYLIMGSIGASFILIGIGFLYAATGTLNMQDLSERIPEVSDSRTVFVAFSFITLGLLIKSAVFPAYAWLPNAYQYAPSSVTVFLAGTATKVSLYVFLRFFFQLFGNDYSFGDMLLSYVLLPLSVIGFFVMSVVAIFQTDIRRVLAYSSIAQIGYIVAGISMATEAGLTAGIVHMLNHAFIKAALFMAVGCIIYRLGTAQIHQMGNLIRLMPWTASAFIVAGLSLVGLPLTAGFVSKWNLVSAAIDSGWWPIAVMILMSSLMAVIYIGKIIEVMCFKPTSGTVAGDSQTSMEVSYRLLVPLWCLVLLSLYMGLNGSLITETANVAAVQLLGGMQ